METDSQNLRDFLRIKQEDNFRNLSGMTLDAILSDKRGQTPTQTRTTQTTQNRTTRTTRQTRPPPEQLNRVESNRTLLDIIREESGPGAYKEKKSWKQFKDKLRLRRNGSGSTWTPTVRVPTSDIPIRPNQNESGVVRPSLLDRNNNTSIRASGRFEHTSSMNRRRPQIEELEPSHNNEEDEDDQSNEENEENENEEEESGIGGGGGGGEEVVRTSLMSLLAETDRQMGLDGLGYVVESEEEDEDEDEEERESEGAAAYNNCCVCMVRHKGAAFIPCGHTFCRLCSRELFAQRGNCPLCNNYILEILDIF